MANRKLVRARRHRFEQHWQLDRRISKKFVPGFIQKIRRSKLRNHRVIAGFVLPTTVLLVLVVTLTAGAMTYRALINSSRVISNVQSKAIYNAATPAVDKARAKIDYLFDKDVRFPSGVPSEEFLISMMLNESRPINGQPGATPLSIGDPYTLTGETRADVNGDGLVDNAWVYIDPNTNNSVIYSISMSTPATNLGTYELIKLKDSQKATGGAGGFYVRSGPASNRKAGKCSSAGGNVEAGWLEDAVDTSILRKRFQVDVLVVNPQDVGKQRSNFATLEFAEDRELDRGNKWGAWFRYDLEIYPDSAAPLTWNGAMHSQGNIMIGNSSFQSSLISSPTSCVFLPQSNSQVSVQEFTEDQVGVEDTKFKGVIAVGQVGANNTNGSVAIHVYRNSTYDSTPTFNSGSDWLIDGSKDIVGISSDPQQILLTDLEQARVTSTNNDNARLADPKQQDPIFYAKRFEVERRNRHPYLDDTYRADNRWGPKVQYTPDLDAAGVLKDRIPTGLKVGDRIIGRPELTQNTPNSDPGLDGYWERRTFAQSNPSEQIYNGGMRIIVGERLELGNPFGWVVPQNRPDARQQPDQPPLEAVALPDNDFDDLRDDNYQNLTANPDRPNQANPDFSDNPGDPLNPPYNYLDYSRAHEAKQRRALRDNLAAVQATAIYHYRINDGKYPAACLITTNHPGTPQTLAQSVNFTQPSENYGVDSRFDFFLGKGTNGWEFTMPKFAFDGATMQAALQNLAFLAGDPDGAFPPKQEAGKVHPDPTLTMFGNFSNLRRAIATPPADRSPADESYLHTAACTLGALGYNINQVQNFDPSLSGAQASDLAKLGEDLFLLINGNTSDGGEVLDQNQLSTYQENGNYNAVDYNPRDYDRVTPTAFLAGLKKYYLSNGTTTDLEQHPKYRLYRLAELIHESYQIRRDRTYGFRPSPAANTWNYNPFVAILKLPKTVSATPDEFEDIVTLWSSACDPNIFKVGSAATGSGGISVLSNDPYNPQWKARVGLSRLCGTVIPPGAIHDYPGDYNYPARNGSGVELTTNLPTTTGDQAQLNQRLGTLPRKGVRADDSIQFGQSNSINNASYRQEKYRRALVAPEFPILYYLFPEFAHDQDGAVLSPDKAIEIDHRQPFQVDAGIPAAFQPWVEPYVQTSKAIDDTALVKASYQVVNGSKAPGSSNASDVASYPADLSLPLADSSTIRFSYKALPVLPEDTSTYLGVDPRPTISGWTLPTVTTVTVPLNDTANPNLIRYGQPQNSIIAAVPFLDRVLFDGRQWLPNRVLDIDLNLLRSTALGGDENWLPVSGIVYAFREDARREDAIARPAGTQLNATNPDPALQMDPALLNFNISPKSIDYSADPDRRDHGFRLRNGASLKRLNSRVPTEQNVHGLTFVSDNSTYILGNFNVHNDADNGSGTRLEEFIQKLPNTPIYSDSEFYDNRTTIDPKFAKPDQDFWRPSEIVADSITILSKKFCDGSIVDTFMTTGRGIGEVGYGIDSTVTSGTDHTWFYNAGAIGGSGTGVYNNQSKALFAPGCVGNKATSFLNQNRPSGQLNTLRWVRENPQDPLSPVKISRNGNGLVTSGAIPIEYGSINDLESSNHRYMTLLDGDGTLDRSRPLQTAFGSPGSDNATNVNAMMISGVVPSRRSQSYGGMHNFPHLLENWQATPLRIAGSFFQLNFSNYATAPYDQEVWEPGQNPSQDDDMIDYYGSAPDHLWGYDVALKLAPASPIAARFTSSNSTQDEFYEEPKVNDPYMQKLCATLKATPSANVPNLVCPT